MADDETSRSDQADSTESGRGLSQSEELAIRREYESRRRDYEALAAGIALVCQSILADAEVPYHSVKSRVKSLSSTVEKINRKRYEPQLSAVTDIVGIRIILLYTGHIDTVIPILRGAFRVIEMIDKRPQADSGQFGYNSVHLLCDVQETSRATLPEYVNFRRMPFEIQVRTILQEAWAEIEHQLVYKSNVAAPTDIRRLIARLSGALEIADEQFQAIYSRRQEYLKKLQASDISGLRDEPLNVDSLQEVIRRRYPWAAGWETQAAEDPGASDTLDQEFEELLAEIHATGITTVRQLMPLIDKWYETEYQESAAKYRSSVEEHDWIVDNPWCHRTRQYFYPIGQIRGMLKKEFTKSEG